MHIVSEIGDWVKLNRFKNILNLVREYEQYISTCVKKNKNKNNHK